MNYHLLNFINKKTHCMYICLHEETICQINKLYYHALYHHKLSSFEDAIININKKITKLFKFCEDQRRIPLLAYCVYIFVKGAYGFRENNIFVENPELIYKILRNKYTVGLCDNDNIFNLIMRAIGEQITIENNEIHYSSNVIINFEVITTTLQRLKKDYYRYLKNRIRPFKEELIKKAWSTKRIEKWLSAGFTIEEISEW
jgi:hypothetical protein